MARRLRPPLVAANWKMHFVAREAEGFCAALLAGGRAARSGVEVAIFPSFPLLPAVARALAGSDVSWGGQDLSPEERGAFTGEVSATQLADSGCLWVLAGHSERRQRHGESDALVALKAAAALRHGLSPLVCVGETGKERRSGKTFEVLARQIAELPKSADLALAYEPVWAIGTGETATPALAAEAHAFLRARLAERFDPGFAAACRILYGGSVTPDNAGALADEPEIDGFLVGGASLDPAKFLAIIAPFAGSGRPSGVSP
ncbi:MAG: triose-phosphate isomerase [Thermoanaerobaculia bacterium]